MAEDAPPFLVTIATQRSGTKFLGTAFSAGGLVRSRGEVFQPGGPAGFGRFFAEFVAARGSFGFFAEEMTAALDAFIERLRAEVAPAMLHFDLMYNNLGGFAPIWSLPMAPPGMNFLAGWLRARRAGVIHLIRPDLAECYASHAIAEARGVYHSGSDAEAARDMALTLSAAEALAYMQPILRARRYVQRAFAGHARYLEITYPAFIAGQSVAPEVAAHIARMAGIPPEETPRLFGASPLRPTAPDKAAVVTNYDDIARLARGLQRMMNDP